MIRKSHDVVKEVKQQARGGKGPMKISYLLRNDETFTKLIKTFARVTLDPGSSIGLHPHNADEEIYYILKGNALFHDDGIDKELKPGDVTITGGGATHSIEAVGSEPLELIAIVAG